MNIVKKGFAGDICIPIEAELADRRYLFIDGQITKRLADDLTKQLLFLSIDGPDIPISLLIDSEGGEIDAGLKICDAVSKCPCTVNAYCFGGAYSMAAVIFESVNGCRNIMKNSKLMIHQPSVCKIEKKNIDELGELSRQLSLKNDTLLSIISDRSGISIEQLKEETKGDRYFDAEEAVSVGLADNIVSFIDIVKAAEDIRREGCL